MRDLVLFLGMLYYVPVSLIAPATGLLLWEWCSMMSPQQLVYGFAYGLRFNAVIAATTLFGWLISRERKRFTPDALPWLMLAFFAWATFNMLFAPYPDFSWPLWDRAIRAFVPVFVTYALLTRKVRIHGMIWTIVISLGFYGVKGGLFTIVTLGGGHVLGPPSSQITDNNALALSLVMELPLVYYLSQHTQHRLLRLGLQIAIVLQIISVFGSYSRGAMIAISIMLAAFWWRTKNKIFYAIVGTIVIVGALSVMPDAFWERMHTLHNVSADSSFEGRVQAWHVAFMYANDHFPFGAGFDGTAVGVLFHYYMPNVPPHVAHSIYFEVLGDQGYPGLALYLLILAFGLRNARIVMRQTRNRPELAWAHDLANMMWISLITYYVGGAALSVAYFDGFLVLLALTSCLRELTSSVLVQNVAEHRRSRITRGTLGVPGADPPRKPGPGWVRPHPGTGLAVGVTGSGRSHDPV